MILHQLANGIGVSINVSPPSTDHNKNFALNQNTCILLKPKKICARFLDPERC